jgi:dephospho-CoA kinase
MNEENKTEDDLVARYLQTRNGRAILRQIIRERGDDITIINLTCQAMVLARRAGDRHSELDCLQMINETVLNEDTRPSLIEDIKQWLK